MRWTVFRKKVHSIRWPFRKLKKHPLLEPVLEKFQLKDKEVAIGWGYRASGRSACKRAQAAGIPLLLLEDAFVRSMRPGQTGAVYGLLADSQGMHYAEAGRSDLLTALRTRSAAGWMAEQAHAPHEVAALMERFRQLGVSKYNWFPGEFSEPAGEWPEGILVVDQTRGDASLRYGGLGPPDFERMVLAAFDEAEACPVYLRGHPDHVMRGKSSCLPERLLRDKRIRFLSPTLPPSRCFPFCRAVFCVGSLMGMEALIHGCKVVTFGHPFYAGRGLTDDRATPSVAQAPPHLSLHELFDLAYLRYCHYFDPDTQEPCGLGTILEHIALQKEMFRRNRGRSILVGFTPWSKQIASGYFRSPAGSIGSAPDVAAVAATADRILIWGRKHEVPHDLAGRCSRVEDGFLRSNGLGAAFNFPYSWVVDHSGIYFDSTGPSDLERILEQGGFTESQLAQAASLTRLLCERRLTKYNLTGASVELDPDLVQGRKVILVPGQVERDMSIAYGSPEIKTNLELLRRVRHEQPDAFVIFKAHPDLVAGTRHGPLLPYEYTPLCDLAVTSGNVLDWMELCDEIHTMTSTVGFEAIIRSVPVVTHGMPFYAGWGLTRDRLTCPRRTRTLTVDELVCGALLVYPRYLNPQTGEFTTAHNVTRILTSERAMTDRRAWYLKRISALKKRWVELSR